MTDAMKTTPPKDRARAARLGIEMARGLQTYLDDLSQMGDDLSTLRYAVTDAHRRIMNEVLTVPGVRIAVFPIDEEEKR